MDRAEGFTRHWTQALPVVAGFINSMIPDFHQAEDLLQNVAVVLLRKFEEYDPRRPFTGWAIGIAKNEILTSRRSHARSFLTYHPELLDAVAAAYEELTPELRSRAAALQECLKEVKGRPWDVLKLRYEKSLKPGDIAERLGMEAGTVRVMLSRIRAALQDCVERRLATGT